MTHLVMIADIAGSRKLTNRAEVQNALGTVLQTLNSRTEQLASPYTITLGDEFQAVYSGADRVFPDLLTVMSVLHPVEIRFSIAVGPLETAINPTQAIGMDGPAFHAARDQLDQMKHEGRVLAISGLADNDGLLEASLALFDHQLQKWRTNRLKILQLLLCDQNIRDIAIKLDISEQSVYKNIRDGSLDAVIQLIQAVVGRLNSALEAAN